VVLSRSVIPVERYAQYVLPALWRSAGGTLAGGSRRGGVPADAALVYRHGSRTLGEVVRATNKFSNNMMARNLLLTLGSTHRGRHIRVSDGIRALQDWLARRGIEAPGLRVVNGAGLSRDTRISARGMANVLRAGRASRYAPEFLASLPIAGEDRALRRRGFAADERSIVRIKTGLIDHVRSMAGYVTSESGRQWLVVVLINHPGVHQGAGTRLHDDIIRYLLER